MSKLVIGDIQTFAIECIIDKDDPKNGNVYLLIKGKRFGEYRHTYDLIQFFEHVLFNLKRLTFDDIGLYAVPLDDIFISYDQAHAEQLGIRSKCKIDNIINGYFDDPSDVDSEMIFEAGVYAFDPVLMIMLFKKSKVRLIVKDVQMVCYKPNIKPEEIEIGETDFFDYLEKLYILYKNNL